MLLSNLTTNLNLFKPLKLVSKQCNSLDTKAVYCADQTWLPPTTCHTVCRSVARYMTHIYLGHGHQNSSSSHK